MSEYIKNTLEQRISSFQHLPYLFVGTGLSMRYSHAPSWNDLLFNIWKIINPTKEERDFKKLKQKIERDVSQKRVDLNIEEQKYYVNPLLATEIEAEFNNRYYSEEDFDTRVFNDVENEEIIDNHYNPFKYFVAKQTSQMQIDETLPTYQELSWLIQNQNKFAGVITTNYDELLESIFKDFSVLIGQDSLLVANSLNIFEIFKIHGCCSQPNSIVLTESDYNNFGKKLKYLSAKLLTIFVEHPIIFIGYGLGDVNIRNIFCEIAECLTAEQLEKIKDNFIDLSINSDIETKEESDNYTIVQTSLDIGSKNIEPVKNEEFKSLKLYPVGQVHGTYIIAENEDGMFILDQHAAHERVNYEMITKMFQEESISIIDMLVPMKFELSTSDYLAFMDKKSILEELGFKIEEFGINTVIIKSHPTWLKSNYEGDNLKYIIDLVIDSSKNFNKDKFLDSLAKMVSCKMSVKANEHLSMIEMEKLLDDLVKCDNPYNCCHGRPSIMKFTNYELEKMFRRVL